MVRGSRATMPREEGSDVKEPLVRLAPLHVFGYNGVLGSGNIKLLSTGHTIYDAGAHLIQLNPKTKEMEIFTGHTEDVACFAIHPDGVLVASGDNGFEPTVLVWDSTNLLHLGVLRPVDHVVDGNVTGETKCSGPVAKLGYRSSSNVDKFAAFPITVHDAPAAKIEKGSYLQIGSGAGREIVEVVGIANENDLTVRRGTLGTMAVFHPNGTVVYGLVARRSHLQQGGISALAFTRHNFGEFLISVGQDDDHTVVVHKWTTGELMAKGPAGSSKVLAVEAHPTEFSMVTCGVGHVSFLSTSGLTVTKKNGVFGSLGRNQTFTCAAYVQVDFNGYGGQTVGEGQTCPGGYVCLTGTSDGFIYMWEGRYLRKVIPYAHHGPMTCIHARGEFCDSVLTGGADGAVRLWDLTDNTAAPQIMDAEEHLVFEYKPRNAVCVRSVSMGAVDQNGAESWLIGLADNSAVSLRVTESTHEGEAIMPIPAAPGKSMERRKACTDRGDKMTVKGKPVTFAIGHRGVVLCTASHPQRPLAASSSEDCTVIIWKLEDGIGEVCDRGPLFNFPWKDPRGRYAGALNFTPDGQHLCLGMSEGGIVLLSFDQTGFKQVFLSIPILFQ